MGKKAEKKTRKAVPSSAIEDEDPKVPSAKKFKLEEDKPDQLASISTSTETTEKEDKQAHKLQLLVSAFSSQQLDQYEIFRRSTFQKSTVKKLVQSVSGGTVSQNVVIAMAGMAKVYVGEIIETACEARDQLHEVGPLRPKHIREAVRKLRKKDKVPNTRHKKVLL